MKKIYVLFCLLLFAFIGRSQSLIYIDSIKVNPPNPVAADSVFLEAWVTTAYQGFFNSDSVIQNGNNYEVRVCYDIGMLTVVTPVYSKTFITINQPGVYNIIYKPYVTGSGSGSSTCVPEGNPGDTVTVTITTGLTKLKQKTKLNVFPNPVSGRLYVQNVNAGDLICIYNAAGCLLKSEIVTQTNYSADVSALPAGICFLKRISETAVSTAIVNIVR